jgi:hypothetical protein
VFLNSRRRETPQKRDETKQTEIFFLSIRLENVFDMDFFPKLYGVFELPLPSNARKCTKKQFVKTKVGRWVGGSGI